MTKREAALRALLAKAEAVLSEDEARAERGAKAVSAIVKAERDIAEFAAMENAVSAETNEEDLRAELRRRIARFVDADGRGASPELLGAILSKAPPE